MKNGNNKGQPRDDKCKVSAVIFKRSLIPVQRNGKAFNRYKWSNLHTEIDTHASPCLVVSALVNIFVFMRLKITLELSKVISVDSL